MSPSGGVLSVIDDGGLRADVDRIAAAVGSRVVHASEPSSHKVWRAASAVVLDATAVGRCAHLGMPRRDRAYLVHRIDLTPDQWRDSIALGVRRVLRFPEQETELAAEFSDAGESSRRVRRGPTVAVLGGRGGAGASVFAAALAMTAGEALLVDLDSWGGGLDLVLGGESLSGLRWPDLTLQGGRVSYASLREALPSRDGVTLLSSGRAAHDIDAGAAASVLDAGSRGGATVVCDLPRRTSPVVDVALSVADLVVLVTCADVRSCAAAAAVGAWLASVNPNVGLVVRGPSPGGLRAADVAQITGLPLVAAMRPQPQLANVLEHGGLTLRNRSPLATAARRVHDVLTGHATTGAAEVEA